MAYRITVEQLGELKEGERYPPTTKIYEQQVEVLNIKSVIDAVNAQVNPSIQDRLRRDI